MTEIHIDEHDQSLFCQSDNPITQYKDAMLIQNDKNVKTKTADLEDVLKGSLFMLSVEEFATFVKFDPIFHQLFNTKAENREVFTNMLYMSLFAQLNYPKSCLPNIQYEINPKSSGKQFPMLNDTLKNNSKNIVQKLNKQPIKYAYGDAEVIFNFDTFSIENGSLHPEQAKQIMQFYAKHYKLANESCFTLYKGYDAYRQWVTDLNSPEDLKPEILDSDECYVLKIRYRVDAKKLPILVQHQLQDCAIKARIFAHKVANANKHVIENIKEPLLKNLITLYNYNITYPNNLFSILITIKNKNTQYNHYSKTAMQSPNARNHLLDSLLKVAGKPAKTSA